MSDSRSDNRGYQYSRQVQREDEESHKGLSKHDGDGKKSWRRERSRSRSPDAAQGPTKDERRRNRARLEQERRERMTRLRAENELEERRLLEKEPQEEPDEKRPGPKNEFVAVNQEELEGLDEEEQMQRLLGFSGNFASTKGKAVSDNSSSAARGAAAKNKARKYRQYMNRKGGFNRPLDKMT